MAELRWTDQAIEQLDSACAYIARDAPRSAQLLATRIARSLERLRDFPRSGRIVPEVGSETVREIIVRSYRVIYRIRSDVVVEVVAVHHSARLLRDIGES